MTTDRKLLLGLALIATALLAARFGASLEAAEDPEAAEHLERWKRAATPGDPHARLAEQAGTWDVTVRWWMAAGAEPVVSTGVAEYRMILGGRYLEEVYRSTLAGSPFEGRGVVGFDNTLGRYVSIWMDTAGTGMSTSTGTCDEAGKTCRSEGQATDLMTGKPSPFRIVTHVHDANRRTFEMFGRGLDGREVRRMEASYVRR